MRALAGKCADAARQVRTIVGASVERIDAGSVQVHQAGETMQGIVRQVQRVSELISEIALASNDQADSVASVNESVTQIDAMTQRNAALAEQGTAAAISLRAQAKSLTRAIAVFSHDEAALA